MHIAFFITLFILSLFIPPFVHPIEIPKAVFIKPSFYGPSELIQSQKKVEEVILKTLSENGVELILLPSIKEDLTHEYLTKLSLDKKVEHIIYGSINILGDSISIDMRIALIKEQIIVIPVYTSGKLNEEERLAQIISQDLVNILLSKDKVLKIVIKGHKRVDMDAIMRTIKTKEGEPIDTKKISDDIKSIYKMGFFDDIQVDLQKDPLGLILTYIVTEKPALKSIKIKGAKKIKEEKIRDVLDLKLYAVINEKKIQENVQKIESLYAEKGYAGTIVKYRLERVNEEASDLIFEIEEGEEVRIKSIDFVGNKAFSDKKLKELMETREKPTVWLPTIKNIMAIFKGDTTVLKSDVIDRDLARIAAFYQNNGYVDVKVGNPEVKREGSNFYITIPIEEGPLYYFGEIDIKEDYFKDKQRILKEMSSKKGNKYNHELLRKDILKITDLYADQGFAYADINPIIQKDEAKKLVNITLEVNTGPKVYFERIDIAGNYRTRDKVIRRELQVMELEPFSATGLKKSKDRLRRLGYFEEVNITPTKGSADDKMNLKVEVKEMPTRSFSIGAGYSSVDKFIFLGEISQRNFLGKGQTLNFRGLLGSQTNKFTLGFREPYLFDSKVSFGIDLYNWERQYTDYTKSSTGTAIEFGYPFFENLKLYLGIRVDSTELSDISENASKIIVESKDIKDTRSVILSASYDTRNSFYLPSRGWNNYYSIEYAGGLLGGDSAFTKFYAVFNYYRPLFKEVVGHVRAGAGYITEGEDGKLPIYEKFFLGGIDSVRGFKSGNVSPLDPETKERIGGKLMGFSQFEAIFPLVKEMGMHGLIFFDIGNVWEDTERYSLSDLKKSVGFGLRWVSPIGPLRIEWGYNIDKQPGDASSNWEFRLGGAI